MEEPRLIVDQIQEEIGQEHGTRKQLYIDLEKELEMPLISFFTSFTYSAMIEDDDAEMLEGLLRKCDLSNGFALLLSSPGGSGLAAERIINVCRSYSKTGEYVAIVPSRAKSAATIVCMGASKIIMGKTSELGTIDPQIYIPELDDALAIRNIVRSYDELFEKAVDATGNLEPYLQQLAKYDHREIEEMRVELELSEDMSVKALRTGMLSKLSDKEIKGKIKTFLTPVTAKVHDRPISAQEAQSCGLNVELADLEGSFWAKVYELYVRLDHYVSSNDRAKCVECEFTSYYAEPDEEENEEGEDE